jgi:hypothetical protein
MVCLVNLFALLLEKLHNVERKIDQENEAFKHNKIHYSMEIGYDIAISVRLV